MGKQTKTPEVQSMYEDIFGLRNSIEHNWK